MNRDLDALHKVYEDLGVHVTRIPSVTTDSVFHRDVVAWTPFGLVQCRMGKATRAWEPEVWFKSMALEYFSKPPLGSTFEGADLLWCGNDHAVIGIGDRTGDSGAVWLCKLLSDRGVVVRLIVLPEEYPQHLLGLMNCVSGSIVSSRHFPASWSASTLPPAEVALKGSNWVEVGRTIIINKGCPTIIKMLEGYGLDVVPVSIEQLLAHGGGVACATGVYAVKQF